MNQDIKRKIITINSRKFDGQIHRTWTAELISEQNSLLTLFGKFDTEISHSQLGVIRRNTASYEFYWLDRWYNVFRFHEPDGNLRNFYCNINIPPTFKDNVLDYTDLEIDVLVNPDFSYQILDVDEFEENARIFSYPSALREKVQTSLRELINLIENRIFPFNYKI